MGQTTEELNTQIAGTRDALASDLDALQDKVSPSAVVQRQKAALGDRMRNVRSKVMGSSGSSSSGSGGPVDRIKDGAGGLAGSAEDGVVGSPIVAGLVAFGAGLLVAGLLPATEKEGELTHRAVDAVKEHGQPIADAAKSAGQDMVDDLKDEAAQAVQQVKDSATESGQRVADEGKSATERVKSETTQ
jgi:gas vesicle protein